MTNSNTLNSYHEQPRWMADNIYLLHGHRPPTNSYLQCLKSVFRLHNETVNIWTHLIPCCVFFILIKRTLTCEDFNLTDKIYIGSHPVGALACHALSSIYHIFACHSEAVGRFFQKLDFIGIILLITLSIVSWIYCLFGYLNPVFARTYTVAFITFASVLAWLITNDKYGNDSHAAMRVIILTLFAISAQIPTIHWLINHWYLMHEFIKFSHSMLLSLIIYLIGTLLYSFCVPERYGPGRFDIFFNSHQLFHFCCTVAALCHYYGMKNIVSQLKKHSNQAP